MSLLFGFFVIINSALIFMQAWSKLLWGLLLVGFIGLFITLFVQRNKRKYDR
jgi:type II secretory pathway component PulF